MIGGILTTDSQGTDMSQQANPQRFVSRLTRSTLALVLAGGRGTRLYELTAWRAKPAVFFGGKFRIVDFALSNVINSDIRRVSVLTQYKAHSLVRHINEGWGGFKRVLNEFIEVLPASQRIADDWYKGTADAIYQNLDIIHTHNPEYVLILSGDHIYKMDYGNMLACHAEKNADLTISCIEVPVAEAANNFGVIEVDDDGRVISFEEKPDNPRPLPGRPDTCLASMGNYIFNTGALCEQLILDNENLQSAHDFAHDIIPPFLSGHNVYAYSFRDEVTGKAAYWRDVGTLDAYWEANMELLHITPELNLYDEEWPIITEQRQCPSAKFVHNCDGNRAMTFDSIVSGGCIITGAQLDHALLFSNVRVQQCSNIQWSVILPDVTIGENAHIHKAIIDRGCHIADGTVIGVDHEEDRRRGFRITENGVVLVTPDMLGQPIHSLRHQPSYDSNAPVSS